MPIRNQNWYDLQASRRYPLDERSTGLDDAGQFIHDDILVDCHIRFPEPLGQYMFVQGITVSPNIVTVVFGVAVDLADTAPTSVAAISLPRNTPQNVNHSVVPLVAGVAGWIAFGPGLDEEFVGRYSTPLQTLISQRCARPYRPLPISSLGKLNVATSLTGIVTLSAQNPVTATYIPKTAANALTVENTPVDSILFQLEGETQAFNPLKEFLGTCGQRPESGTCPRPPIATINGISPDCNGNIDLVFNGVSAAVFENCGGVAVTSDTGLADACAAGDERRRPPPQDECTPGSESADDIIWYDPPTALPFEVPDVVSSESVDEDAVLAECATMPLCRDFTTGAAADFAVREGLFVFESVSAPEVCNPPSYLVATPENELTNHYVYTAANIAGRNLSLFKNCASDWAINRTVTAELQITATGLQRNGGVLFNYIRGNAGLGIPTRYLVATLDANAAKLRLLRFNGSNFVNEYSAPFSVVVGAWYRVSATPVAIQSEGAVLVNIAAAAVDDSVSPVSFSLLVAQYGDPIGLAGLFSAASYTRFNKFTIENTL